MKTNNIVTRMRAGQMAYGCAIGFPSTALVELMGRAGFDYVMFDAEHGPFTPESLDDLCRVADMAGLTPIARVPSIEHHAILRFLDRGILGILGPHITTPQRARQLAEACRYAPRGKRSMGDGRGSEFMDLAGADAEYIASFNDQVLVMAQLEDVEVLDHLDEILAVEGIDLFASGRQDIAQSMGLPGQPNHPRVLEFEQRVTEAVHAAGKRMTWDVMTGARAANLFLDGARAFLKERRG